MRIRRSKIVLVHIFTSFKERIWDQCSRDMRDLELQSGLHCPRVNVTQKSQPEFNVKLLFRVIQGHIFRDHRKAVEGLYILYMHVPCILSKIPEQRAVKTFDAPSEYPHMPYISRNQNHLPTFYRRQFVSIFVQIFLVGSEKLFYFCKSDVSAVRGHPRSLILVPIESAYATSYWSVIIVTVVLSCDVSEIL